MAQSETDRPEPEEIDERLEYYEDMVVLHVPFIDWPISVNKVHAMVYGLVGFWLGRLYFHDPLVGIALTLTVALGALGLWIREIEKGTRIGLATIKYKPHYFYPTLLASWIVGVIVPL